MGCTTSSIEPCTIHRVYVPVANKSILYAIIVEWDARVDSLASQTLRIEARAGLLKLATHLQYFD